MFFLVNFLHGRAHKKRILISEFFSLASHHCNIDAFIATFAVPPPLPLPLPLPSNHSSWEGLADNVTNLVAINTTGRPPMSRWPSPNIFEGEVDYDTTRHLPSQPLLLSPLPPATVIVIISTLSPLTVDQGSALPWP